MSATILIPVSHETAQLLGLALLATMLAAACFCFIKGMRGYGFGFIALAAGPYLLGELFSLAGIPVRW